jgi:hypothetical protein
MLAGRAHLEQEWFFTCLMKDESALSPVDPPSNPHGQWPLNAGRGTARDDTADARLPEVNTVLAVALSILSIHFFRMRISYENRNCPVPRLFRFDPGASSSGSAVRC